MRDLDCYSHTQFNHHLRRPSILFLVPLFPSIEAPANRQFQVRSQGLACHCFPGGLQQASPPNAPAGPCWPVRKRHLGTITSTEWPLGNLNNKLGQDTRRRCGLSPPTSTPSTRPAPRLPQASIILLLLDAARRQLLDTILHRLARPRPPSPNSPLPLTQTPAARWASETTTTVRINMS